MSFTNPFALLLLLTIPFILWVGWPRTHASRRRRDWVILAVRLFIVLLLSLALAGLQFVQQNDSLAVIFLVDVSDSIRPAQRTQAETFVRGTIEALGPDDMIRRWPAGARPVLVLSADFSDRERPYLVSA